MRKKYLRSSLSVEAEKYEPGKNMEDGFEPWTKVVTAGWIITEGLVKLERENGQLVCPFIYFKTPAFFSTHRIAQIKQQICAKNVIAQVIGYDT